MWEPLQMYVYVYTRVIACECSLVSTTESVRDGACIRMCTCKCFYVCAYVVKVPEKERVYACSYLCVCVWVFVYFNNVYMLECVRGFVTLLIFQGNRLQITGNLLWDYGLALISQNPGNKFICQKSLQHNICHQISHYMLPYVGKTFIKRNNCFLIRNTYHKRLKPTYWHMNLQ